MRFSRRQLAFVSYASRIVLSAILSLLLAAGPDWPAVSAATPVPPVQVTLTAFTLPSQGQAGSSVIYVMGSPYPAGTIPAAGVTVSFATSCGGTPAASATASAFQLLYGATRRAQVLIPAPLTANTYFVSISGTASSGTPFVSSNCSQVQVTSGVGPASKLAFSTQPGNGKAGSPLGNVVVQVQDANGNVVTGSNASITITSTAAGVGGTTTVAAVNGVATFSNLVFTAAGSYTLTAASAGITSATSTPFAISAGAPAKLVFSTEPTNGAAGSPLASVVVQVQDASRNVVTGSSASITISSTAAGVGGTTTVAAVNGVATFSNLVFTTAGSYTLTAASTGITSATSTPFTITAGTAVKLVFSTEPTNGTAGSPLASVVVQVQDASGNVVINSNAMITIISTTRVGGTTTVAAVNGVAMFSNLVFTTAGSYKLTAASAGITNATSTPFTISAGAAAKLVFSTEPTDGTAGSPLASVIVKVLDANGNVVTGSSASITISSTVGVGGTTTVAAANGVGTFSNLVFATAGSYTLTAASASISSATSTLFTISAGAAAKLVFSTEPANGTAGTPLASVILQVQDGNGNVVTGSSASITISSTAAGVGGATTVAAVNGVATFSNLVFATAGSYTLTAASAGITSTTSTPFTISLLGPTSLVFTMQPPPQVQTGQLLLPGPQVTLENLSGAVLTSYNGPVTISIGNNPSRAILSGTLTQNAVSGVATFLDLSLNTAGNGFTLVASVPGLSATSAQFNVRVSSKLASCLPSSSLGVLLPAGGTGSVTAYAPNGSWSDGHRGIQVVPIEGGGPPAVISTPNPVNSCASNSVTGETVCVANNTDVYLISGSTLNNTLTSSGSGVTFQFDPALLPAARPPKAPFLSGSWCLNCGVAINGVTNTAVIEMGLTSGLPPFYSALQFLDLATNTFSAPFPLANDISEDIQWDSIRNLILSPSEYQLGDVGPGSGFNGLPGGNYDLIDTSSSTPTEFGRLLPNANFDAAAEDCTTGIALSGLEGDVPPPFQSPASRGLFISDLTQATFTAGSPGSWTAPGQFVAFPEFYYLGYLGAGTPAVAVPPGSHLAVVTGEEGGDQLGVVELPSTSGSGTPGFGDYAAAELPRTPDGQSWSQGFDPHTITAYVSPDTGRPMAIFANSSPPTWLAVIDLQGLLDAPRVPGVFPGGIGSPCPSCTHTVDPSYDLVANGVVRYIGAPPLIAQACPTTGQPGQLLQQVNLTGNHTHWTQATTTASFGPGITVESLSVSDPTHATAIISIDPTADLGPRTVATATGSEVATAADPYMVTALASISPSTGQQGQQNLSVTLTGQFTNWVSGVPRGSVTQASFGAGITVTSLTVNSPTSMTAVLNIDPSAPAGPRPLTITNNVTGCDTQTFSSGFTVTAGAPILESVNPNSGQQGQQNLSVVLTGNGTNWLQGTTTVSFGTGITVASLTVNSPSSATAVLNISASAAVGPQTVTITTGGEVETHVNGFAVISAVNPFMLVEPNTGQPGQQNLSVLIEENFGTSYWVPGLTTASFGPGITVNSLTVNGTYAAIAVLNISPAAATGPRTVTLTTGSEVDSLINGFTVTSGTTGPPAKVAFVTQPTNTTAGQPISAVRVAVEDAFGNLVTTTSNAVSVVIATGSASGTLLGTTSQAAINGVATFGDLNISKSGDYTLEAFGAAVPSPAVSDAFAITPGPATQLVFTMAPSTAAAGQSVSVEVAVEDALGNIATGATNPVSLALATNPGGATLSGTTIAVPSAGIAVFSVSINKPGPVYSFTASSPGLTSASSTAFVVNLGAPSQLVFLTQPISFALNATMNPAQVAVEDRSGNVVPSASGVATIALLQNPSGGTLLGAFSAPLVNGIAAFPGLSINKAGKGYSLTASVADLDLPPATSNSFDVLPSSGPTIISVSPNVALQGASLQIAITALNTHFVQGQSVANFGPGVSVGGGLSGAFGAVQVTSATTAIAQVSVAANATPGLLTVAVRTGSEEASLVNGFAVNGSPFLSSLSPSFSQPGQTLLVTIKGVFTNFRQGTTQATFGSGISVGGAPEGGPGLVFVNDAVTAIATLTINAAATPGLRAVTAQTGGEQATLQGGGFLVLGSVTGPFPIVSIDSPTEGAEVTSPTVVTGTVTSPNLASWTLDYQGSDSTIFTTFATGTSATVSGTFDPTLLLNGLAVIRLTAVDQSGQTGSTIVNVAVARKLKVGVFTVSFNDLTIPVAGIPIQITRTYDSRFKGVGDFGVGWTLSIKSLKVSVNGRLGMNWQGDTEGDPLVPVYCITPAQNHLVTVRLPGDQLYQFQPVLTAGQVDFSGDTQNGCQFLTPLQTVDVSFVPVGATPANATLTAVNGTALFVSGTFGAIGDPPAPIQLVDSVTGNTFDPDQFQLTMPTGQTFLVSRTFGVQSVTDTNNNTLTITTAGITSSTGKGISFARDAQNRITTITDPMGHALTYAYDAITDGNLATFTDQLNNISTFTYDSAHNLLSYTDPRGIQPLRNIYDDSGRLIEQIDASGHVQDFNHLTATNTEAWTDFLGNTTRYVYDSHGNIIQETDPLGNVTSRTFDANDNLLTETNALGQTRTYTYDAANNQLTQTDPLGHTTAFTYNSLNKVLTVTDPNGNTTTNTYDSSGKLLTSTDPLGNITRKTYDGGGNLLSTTDAAGHTQSSTFDGYGNVSSSTDAAGVVTSYTYDINGNRLSQTVTRTTAAGNQTLTTQFQYDAHNRLVKTVLPDGSAQQTIYNAIGKDGTTIDELGHQTTYVYDDAGRLLQTTYADGTNETSSYDADGHRTQFTSRSGATSSYSYDAAGHLVTMSDAIGGTVTTTYDAVGKPISTTDPLGSVTKASYDNAGRQIKSIDALGAATNFSYDQAGQMLSRTDANGNTTSYQYDADGRRTKTLFADGTTQSLVYDAIGKITSRVDQAGHARQYAYDANGRLVTVTNEQGQVTHYTYDEVSNRLSQADANGNTTQFAYDQRGRQISRTLPKGEMESFTYDAAGNLITHTDFNGHTTTYAYDSLRHLISRTPDPSFNTTPVIYTYTASGQRASMFDVSGTTTYTYDLFDQLTSKQSPQGAITYTHNATGNLTQMTAGNFSVSYTYDAANRLSSVTEPTTGTTSYAYDTVGNLQRILYPNGVSHAYTFDALNRLTNLNASTNSAPLASYSYTMNASGHKLSVAELAGRNVSYSYDPSYRLTAETITGATAGPNGAVSYGYDAVGNRIQTTSTLSGIASGTFYYYVDDRLGIDTYDSNGNTVSSGGVSNTYDYENRIVQHGGVTIVYDGDGNRVSKTVGGVTTTYLVSDLNPTGFPQVIMESAMGGSSRLYVYGQQRISQSRFDPATNTTTNNFYLYDGHGSVRALADSSGAVTDRYDYDAFGNLIYSTGSTPNHYLYSGEEFDSDLGLYYNRARYLNAGTGRFFTMDPVRGDPGRPESLHSYLYASDDPVDRVDPAGTQDLSEVAADIAIIGVLASPSSFAAGPFRSGEETVNINNAPPDSNLSLVVYDARKIVGDALLHLSTNSRPYLFELYFGHNSSFERWLVLTNFELIHDAISSPITFYSPTIRANAYAEATTFQKSPYRIGINPIAFWTLPEVGYSNVRTTIYGGGQTRADAIVHELAHATFGATGPLDTEWYEPVELYELPDHLQWAQKNAQSYAFYANDCYVCAEYGACQSFR
jgi:RHS repeat-associated protein